jgi:hypothetical protein
MDLFEVTLIAGRQLTAADANGLSDPFVRVKHGKRTQQSHVVSKSLAPLWNQVFYVPVDSTAPDLVFECWDRDEDDPLAGDDFLGEVRLPAALLLGKDKFQNWFPLVASSAHSARYGVSGQLAIRVSHKVAATRPADAAKRAAAAGAVAFRPVSDRPRATRSLPPAADAPAANNNNSANNKDNSPDAAARARVRWGRVRTALMAKSLFCRKVSSSELYGAAVVASAAELGAGQMAPEAAAAYQRIISECQRSGKKFTDPDFPPTDRSLYRDPSRKPAGSSCTGWKRLSELSAKPQLFKDGVEAGDVIQGQLGDCWFLGALSVVAEREKLFFNLFNTTEANAFGVYSCRFFHNGAWEDVIVDDHVPVTYGDKLLNARGSSVDEMWVPLIEKAFAKMNGCYEALVSGSESEAFVAMTGCPPEELEIAKIADLGAKLRELHGAGTLLGASCNRGGVEEARDGLLMRHAYGILDIVKLSLGVTLVKLRNPWGKLEWTGDWSDHSPLWNAKLRTEAGSSVADDGVFFMSVDDVKQRFTTLFVCKLVPSSWSRAAEFGEWSRKGGTAGGCTNFPFWRFNPQLTLNVPTQAAVSLLLSQPSQRLKGTMYPQIGLYVAKAKTAGFKKLDMPKADVLFGHEFVGSREQTVDLVLPPGSYAIMASTYNPGHESPHSVTVFSEAKVELLPAKDWYKCTVNGVWRGATAAGCSNNPQWANNSQYQLELPQQTTVTVLLAPHNTPKKPHIGFLVFRDAGSRLKTATAPLHTASFVDAPVSAELTLAAGRYVIVPSTFDAGVELEFQLSVFGTGPVALAIYGGDLTKAVAQKPAAPALKKTGSADLRSAAAARPEQGATARASSDATTQQAAVSANESIESINKQVVFIRGKLNEATTTQEIVPAAKALVQLRPHFETMRTLLPEQPRAKEKPKPDDKLAALRQTVIGTLTDMYYVLIGARVYVSDTASADATRVAQLDIILGQMKNEFAKLASSL